MSKEEDDDGDDDDDDFILIFSVLSSSNFSHMYRKYQTEKKELSSDFSIKYFFILPQSYIINPETGINSVAENQVYNQL